MPRSMQSLAASIGRPARQRTTLYGVTTRPALKRGASAAALAS